MELKKAFDSVSKEEMKYLLDIPIWLALTAAYRNDGVVSESEKADAVKLAHLRTFTAPKSLQQYYEKVDGIIEKRFEVLNSRLPKSERDREIYLVSQIKRSHALIKKLDRDVAETLEASLASFYEHVFRADKSFFQYFALPVISNRLDKKSRSFNFEKP
ncbi:MAG TPA: hypothetical protein VJ911_07105 [Cryomorphaceae bacterium]|nr:hypothetical protein [Cryomorphaceae bacterium]